MSSKDIRISIHLRNDPNILKITEIVYDNSNIKINVMKVVDNKKNDSTWSVGWFVVALKKRDGCDCVLHLEIYEYT